MSVASQGLTLYILKQLEGNRGFFKKYNRGVITLSVILLVLLFILRYGPPNENLTPLTMFFKYSSHWSAWLFPIFGVTLLVGITVMALTKESSVWRKYLCALWLAAAIGCFVFMYGVEQLMEGQELQMTLFYYPLIGFFLFDIIFLFNLFGVYEYKAKLTEKSFDSEAIKKAVSGEDIVYETSVIQNFPWFATFTSQKRYKLILTQNKIIIGTSPLTTILFKDISKIKFDKYFSLEAPVPIIITLKNGTTYKIAWGSTNESVPFDLSRTNDIYEAIKRHLPTT